MGEEGERYAMIMFEDTIERHAFVRKVLGIVFMQLFLTLGIVIPFAFVEQVKMFALDPRTTFIYFICAAVTFVIGLSLGCCESVRRSFPVNMILLLLFTVAEGILIGFVCASRYPMHVVMALGITSAVCFVLILFALQTKWDFTGFMPFLLVAFFIFAIMGIVSIFIRVRTYLIVLNSFGVLLFSIFLIIDIQMMLGGKNTYQFDPEDYVGAAISIYMDIISLFLYILNLLGLTLDDE